MSTHEKMESKGQTVLYARVSTAEQNLDRQKNPGFEIDRVFEDKCSGKDTNRPALQECMNYLRSGDVLLVWEISRLARNLQDLLTIVNTLNKKGVTVKFLTENLTFSANGSDAFSELQLSLLGAFASFERKLIRQRQAEGIKIAKENGRYKNCGRKPALSEDQIAEAKTLIESGLSKNEVARRLLVSRHTIYKAVA